ncbi:MAG: hypothetical protein Q7J68_07690 [Thermoplasmata archaeon]|nr:hypothetical protein [Thermoplasmata archaeon]
MSQPIDNILNYTEPPSPEEHLKRSRMLWLVAAVSLSMAAIGYLIMATMIL